MQSKHLLPQFLVGTALFCCAGQAILPDLKPNTWTRISQDMQGARRSSSFRYVEDGGYFLLWGFMGYVMDNYGNPDKPWAGNKEYDIVVFDPKKGKWESQYPYEKEAEWRGSPPPLHMCSYYQGITIGSHRPQLKEREGVLRPDLNLVFDQVTYDSRRARMLYFTGGRTFAYSVKERKWSDAAPGSTAPPVLGGSLTYDRVTDEAVLFGGGHVAETGPQGTPVGWAGTWIYDCKSSRWRPLNNGTEPSPRLCTRPVCDRKKGVIVLFGGDSHSSYLADTWLYDMTTRRWRASKAAGGPPPRAGHFTVYDPATGWVIIGGGYNRQNLTDMWAFDAAADKWMKLKGEVPVGFHVTADIASGDGLIILTTSTKTPGDTMRCNEIYPVRTTYAFKVRKDGLVDAAVKPQLQKPMLKRSIAEATAGTQPDPKRRSAQLQRIRNMPANEWVLFTEPGRAAPLRTWGSCSFDIDKNRIVYWGGGHCGYGGADYDFYDVEQNTWTSSPTVEEYPERNWDKSGGVYPAGLMISGAPFMRHGRKCYAYDPESKGIVNMKYIFLTAGYEPEFLKNFYPVKPDFGEGENFKMSGYHKWVTWLYQPQKEKWEVLCPTLPGLDLLVTTPHGVMGVNYWWEAPKNRPDMVMFEGQSVVENAVFHMNVAGRRWEKLAKTGPWPQNLYEQTSLVYDSKREQLILHGGGPEQDELWKFKLSGDKWEKIEPQFAPGAGTQPPVCTRDAVYVPSEDVLLTAGQPAHSRQTPAVYAYHVGENRWYKVDLPVPAGKKAADLVSWNRSWVFDPKHNLVLMLLGERAGDDAKTQVFALRYDHSRAKIVRP